MERGKSENMAATLQCVKNMMGLSVEELMRGYGTALRKKKKKKRGKRQFLEIFGQRGDISS